MGTPPIAIPRGFPDLDRLVSAYSGDPGLFLLGACSFIEGYLSHRYPETARSRVDFRDRLVTLRHDLKTGSRMCREDYEVFATLNGLYRIASLVRHRFVEVGRDEARAAAHAVVRFCKIVGITSEKQLTLFQNVVEGAAAELENSGVSSVVRRIEQEALAASDDWQSKGRSDALKHSSAFLEYLQRFSFVTRNRADYLRGVMNLTTEQADAVRLIGGVGDFLVTGPAGTGKTLVLLHALKQHVQQGTLALDDAGPVVLLTFSDALVRFNLWLTRLIGAQEARPLVTTIDGFVEDRWSILDADHPIDDKLVPGLARSAPVSGASTADLAFEIDRVIIASNCSYADYVSGPEIPLSKLQLNGDQKSTVWELAQYVLDQIARYGRVTPGYARRILRSRLTAGDESAAQLRVHRVFLDEAQDIEADDLALLKLFTREGIVVAGDRGQAIWRLGLSYRQAGIMVQGRARILKTVFRNTRPVYQLAAAWREEFSPENAEPGDVNGPGAPAAGRDGPLPYIESVPRSEINTAVLRLVESYHHELSYDYESLTVLTLYREEALSVASFFSSREVPVSDVRADGFDFDTSLGVRVCSVRAAKGIEFPVVFLVVSALDFLREPKVDRIESLFYNTMYVGMTRAIDHLLFIVAEEVMHLPPLQALQSMVKKVHEERR